MANLLTTGEIASIKKDLVDVFDTFSNNRDIEDDVQGVSC